MELEFSSKWDKRMGDLQGHPTYFTNKIAKNLWQMYGEEFTYYIENKTKEDEERFDLISPFEDLSIYESEKLNPKYHTIREDKSDRWHEGADIHFVVNRRSERRFQFAPVIKCTGVQGIQIIYQDDKDYMPLVTIGNTLLCWDSIEKLAINDGFPSAESFFDYFNKDFKGKIIHWTGLRY